MRCAVCEEPVEVLDWCYSCAKYLDDFRSRRGPAPVCKDPTVYPGHCVRGHERYWGTNRWRCRSCEAMYTERNREARLRMRRILRTTP